MFAVCTKLNLSVNYMRYYGFVLYFRLSDEISKSNSKYFSFIVLKAKAPAEAIKTE